MNNNGIEHVEFVTDRPNDQDTLGLRLNGNRSVGVFVSSIQGGSLADKVLLFESYTWNWLLIASLLIFQDGKIQPGDQLLHVDNISLAGTY